MARDKSAGQQEPVWNQRKQILIMSVEVLAKQVESPVVETHIATHAIKRLTCGQDRLRAVGYLAREPLHRTSVKVECAEVEIRVVAGAGRSRRLDLVTARGIALQVKAIGEACINVFEV